LEGDEMTQDGRLERGRVRRELLLTNAVALIASRGSRQLTQRATATESGVSLASVTYHFPSIDDLRRAAFNHAGARVGLAFRALIEAQGLQSDRVPEITAEYVAALVDARGSDTLAVLEMILAAVHDEHLRPIIRELDGHLADLLTPYVGERDLAFVVAASIQGLMLDHLARSPSSDSARLRRSISDLIHRFEAAKD
jgi:DNA-binding transcriptional regulator YbjK